jgi:transposase InsO family protein
MPKAHVIITAITIQHLSYRQVATQYGVSKSWAHQLHKRWLAEGESALTPASKRPRSSPNAIPETLRQRILQLRFELTSTGFDAGAHTIAEHLNREGHYVSVSTIWRTLRRAEVVTPQPQKRPRSSYQRFTADQPNSMWQSDFTHWALANGRDTEIIGWIDDHARFLLHLSAHPRVTGTTVTSTFTLCTTEHGKPVSTLTDNGMVYTTRLSTAARGLSSGNAFETLLALEGIIQKNGRPYKPTTQGKIERLWQTLKLFLKSQNPPTTIDELQHQLDTFRNYYNHVRPHRALGRRTPHTAYTLIPKAEPSGNPGAIWKVRYDIVNEGKITIRFGNKLLHLGLGRAHERTDVIALIKNDHATVIDTQGTVLGEYQLDPKHRYQHNTKTREPPFPGVHVSTMS